MNITKTGFILKTEHYQACIDFYSQVIGLKCTGEKVEGDFKMSTFDFSDSYLLIETHGQASSTGKKDMDTNPFVMRFNVLDIQETLAYLQTHNVDAEYFDFDWGKIVMVFDPDGNRIEFMEK
ncbi:VOC family protein [Marinicellulosiphila megalodicopiae]|uniref:VOC family protein n=1 Tax=Marinicellulosiphila megalodicopiae TaxID=2724896 RepID=UPI003BAF8A97